MTILNYHGREFTAIINGFSCTGKISVEKGEGFLCQNVANGKAPTNTFGYKYGWWVGSRDIRELGSKDDYSLKLIPINPETYKDFKEGDEIINSRTSRTTGKIEWVYNNLVIYTFKNTFSGIFVAASPVTKEELYNDGWRLHIEPEPIVEEPIKEVTLEEVAKAMGVSVDKLRIKD